jgi:hypothetical protein
MTAAMRGVLLSACLLLACLSTAGAAEQQAPAPSAEAGAAAQEKPAPPPVIRRIGPDLVQVGAVVVDAKTRTIRCKGHVAMSEGGPLDLLACLPTGKSYESIFTLDMRPMDLQVALLLLGLTPGRNPAYKYQPDESGADRKPGDEVLLYVEWTPTPKAGETPKAAERAKDAAPAPAAALPAKKRVRAEEFLFSREKKQSLKDVRWVFLGSTMTNGRFGADLEGSLIATYHDPLSILELDHPMIGEDQYQDMDYSINSVLCPPVGTPIDLVVELPHKEAQAAPKAAAGKSVQEEKVKEEEHVQDKP